MWQIHPTYMPRAADVWMYHHNPPGWILPGVPALRSVSFSRILSGFFTFRFAGMTPPVAEFLANKVFYILPDPMDDSPCTTAKEFGLRTRHVVVGQVKAATHASIHPYGHGHTGPSAPSVSSTSFISYATTRHGTASANLSVISLDDRRRGRCGCDGRSGHCVVGRFDYECLFQ
ncbi:hypothetical protein PHLGIDRAFT_390613 [Phlebiopsis gigantea 11061_1 CR5-6]|uniref:Uncharacterized protein n=1 Tax=Phlebiopsis gigantea (strain 11061_1 CR5-6) TaxID=745531 RepID=A0A0C3RYA9_PHLG1|nr:hypothetical protein PHLGIDRAFT_390613 [Phlebiopsis gigantea 11061_1 CR5-6]